MQAINHALTILGWMELGEDCPPESIWMDDDAIASYFVAVRESWRNGTHGTAEYVEEQPLTMNHDELIQMWRNG